MPNWTPPTGDKVTFATVEEAQFATPTDVESYLIKLKSDCEVGEPGYPSAIVITGDQQKSKGFHIQLDTRWLALNELNSWKICFGMVASNNSLSYVDISTSLTNGRSCT